MSRITDCEIIQRSLIHYIRYCYEEEAKMYSDSEMEMDMSTVLMQTCVKYISKEQTMAVVSSFNFNTKKGRKRLEDYVDDSYLT